MRKHGGTPSRRDKHVTLAAISPPGVAPGRFVGGHKSGLAGSKPPPLFTRGTSSCSSQGRRQGEPWGASPGPSAPTYLPGTATTTQHFCFVNVVAMVMGCYVSLFCIFLDVSNAHHLWVWLHFCRKFANLSLSHLSLYLHKCYEASSTYIGSLCMLPTILFGSVASD